MKHSRFSNVFSCYEEQINLDYILRKEKHFKINQTK